MCEKYTYLALRARIMEKYGTNYNFASALNMTPQNFSRKMNGETTVTQDDMVKWAKLLDIKKKDFGRYFFT